MTIKTNLDPRLNAYRADRAALKLEGKVEAPLFVGPNLMQVAKASVPLRKAPEALASYETELLYGETFEVYAKDEDAAGMIWLWGQAPRDGYVGYAPENAFAPQGQPATHRVMALRSFLYPGPGMKAPPLAALPYGAECRVIGQSGAYAQTPEGYIYARHPIERDSHATDPVAEAERFPGTPYLWGGKTSLGLDCSGLVQTACFACGIKAPRDSDMQEAMLGEAMGTPQDLSTLPRGTLLFWPGHVALSQGGGMMIHANAFHMMVVSEPVLPALERIAANGTPLRSLRRL